MNNKKIRFSIRDVCGALLLFMFLFTSSSTIVHASNTLKIYDADGFIDFSNDVYNGTNYSGTTVYLGSDLDFNGKTFVPVGNASTSYFLGTFDGQGHIISNIAMTSSSSEYVGLFSYSNGLTIRNVVIDESCSFTNTYYSDFVWVGGAIGSCHANIGSCTIENNVNMATISFNGTFITSLYLGGIVGSLRSYNHESRILNCINYGDLYTFGSAGANAHIGGIVGDFDNGYRYIQNCVNHGNINHNATMGSNLWAGGVAGEIYEGSATFENFVNTGKIIFTTVNDYCVGNVVGKISYDFSSVKITNCFWISGTNCNKLYGSSVVTATTLNSHEIEINQESVGSLNEKAESNSWNKWILNANNDTLSFDINNRGKTFSFSSKLVLLPDYSGNVDSPEFSGWYSDQSFTQLFNANEILKNTTLYGFYKDSVAVTFNFNYESNTSTDAKVVTFNDTYGSLPSLNRTGHTFIGWFNDNNKRVTSDTVMRNALNHTLYAHWEINNYTVKFDLGNGTFIEKIFSFNETIVYPENINREGYMLDWATDIKLMPASNITITANWTEVFISSIPESSSSSSSSSILQKHSLSSSSSSSSSSSIFKSSSSSSVSSVESSSSSFEFIPTVVPTNPSSSVEIIFSSKDLTSEEIKEIISRYTNNKSFEMSIVEYTEEGARVIVKFNDVNDSVEFFRKVELSGDTIFRNISFYGKELPSSSWYFIPSFLLIFIML